MPDRHHTLPGSGLPPLRARAPRWLTGVWLGLALALTALPAPAQGWRHGHAGAAGPAAASPPCRPARGGPWGSGYGWRLAATARAASAPASAAPQHPVTTAAAAQGCAVERDATATGRCSLSPTQANADAVMRAGPPDCRR